MAAVTDKDLEQKRASIERLREQITTQEAKASSVVQEQNNAIEMAQLEAEEARLQAQLAAAREQAKVSNIRSGSDALTDTLHAARDAAAEITPPGVAVDTNAGREKEIEAAEAAEPLQPPAVTATDEKKG